MDSNLNQCWNCRKKGRFHCKECSFAFYCSRKCQQMDIYRHEVECRAVIIRRTCIGCGQRPPVLVRCDVCLLAYYCNEECQSRHWPQHQYSCNEIEKKILSFARKTEIFHAVQFQLPWYIGNYIAEDYLRLHQNEGSSVDRELRLLFVGVGDIKNAIRTITDLPPEFNGKLQFVLNDDSPHICARNLLLIYCALASPMAEHLVHIWYSVHLTPKVLKYLVARLKELTTLNRQEVIIKMRNCVTISSDHWSKCIPIWKGWYKLALDVDAANRMRQMRNNCLSETYCTEKLDDMLLTLPQEHRPSVKDFVEKGLLLPLDAEERSHAVFPNCTMTCYSPFNPKYKGKFADIQEGLLYRREPRYNSSSGEEMIYCVYDDSFVLRCWDYLVVKETVGKKDDVLDMYLSYLTGLFQTFSDQIGSGRVIFRFIVDDFHHLDQYLAANESFDRISVFFYDLYCYPNLLKQFGPRLNKDNNCSVLITHHEIWAVITEFYEWLETAPDEVFERGCKDAQQRKQVLAGVHNKNKQINELDCCVEDYYDETAFLLSFLASHVVYSAKHENLSVTRELIKHPEQVAKIHGLHFREYCCELNHVVPFKRDGNTRRVSLQRNYKRYLEWVLPCKADH